MKNQIILSFLLTLKQFIKNKCQKMQIIDQFLMKT